MRVIDIDTKQIFVAEYAANKKGNMRMWVNGKFYSDKQFGKKFKQIDPSGNYIKTCGEWHLINH